MPTYDYQCQECQAVQEQFFKMADKPPSVPCACGGTATPIVSLGHGGVHGDEPVWLNDDVRMALQDPKERPIRSRTEWKRHLDKKGLVPVG